MSLFHVDPVARRAVACPRWRWMPGMRYEVGLVAGRLSDTHFKGKLPLVASALPALSDAATLGCLLALVRELHGEPTLFVERHAIGPAWQVHSVEGGIFGEGSTEEEALVAALEAAP